MVFIEYLAKKTVKYLFLILLPFFIFAKGSLHLYIVEDFSPWMALLTSGIASLIILTIYGIILDYKINGSVRPHYIFFYSAFPVIIVGLIYGLFYISEQNTKTESVREHYLKLHPLIRPSMALIILIDKKLVVTETKRELKDYSKMGLPNNHNSLHFVQEDNYVHAVDIRTLHRPEWKNVITKWYFKLMGLDVLRHVGSADHLHISLPQNRKRLKS